MGFKNIECKLGNMRKVQDWVLYPQDTKTPHLVLIQCEQRIARVDMNTSKALLSSGKGGHQGFHMLSPQLGAKVVDVAPEIIDKLKELTANAPTGAVMLGGSDENAN